MTDDPQSRGPSTSIQKCPTGIEGFDSLAGGGLPLGRPTLVCGGPGAGKTVLALEFLGRGVLRYNEPGVFATFDESPDELKANSNSLGLDLATMVADKKIFLNYVQVDRGEIEDSGEYNLDGLFISLAFAIDSLAAKRLVIDGMDAVVSNYSNDLIVRAQVQRLFRWIKSKGITAVVTAEAGTDTLTRLGIDEHLADCVVALDHRVNGPDARRLLRIVKYRGSGHAEGEHPFVIDSHGLSVQPLTSREA